jgi:DNA-binding MarR family transcriptional regulator
MNGKKVIPSGLKDSVQFHLDSVLRINNRRADRLVMEGLGLSLREALIIQAASSEPPLSQGYMADLLGINRNVMVLEIDRLDDQQGSGHLKRERRPESRREATIVLTPKGRRTLAAINKLRAQVWHDILRPSTSKQISDLLAWARAVIETAGPPPSSKPDRKKKAR